MFSGVCVCVVVVGASEQPGKECVCLGGGGQKTARPQLQAHRRAGRCSHAGGGGTGGECDRLVSAAAGEGNGKEQHATGSTHMPGCGQLP